VQIAITVVPLVFLWLLIWATLDLGYWLSLLLAVPTAGFLLRLFMIQHDCSHGAFFSHRFANDWIGRVIGVVTMTPYDLWRRTHAIHHATSGNLDRRGFGDVDTLTVREYRERSFWGRMRYRLYRHPLVMFGLGPAYIFFLQHRLPVGLMRDGWEPWISTMATNVAIAAIIATLSWFIGIKAFLLVHLPIMMIAASIGVWLFYVQHQFENDDGNTGTGTSTRRHCMEARITTCRESWPGLQRISAFTTSTICAAGSLTTACRACCAIIRSCAASVG
jgi:omega-6 fatty acid desaturase (delta-12 desaturase)